MFQPEIETMPAAQLRELQEKRLQELFAWVDARVPFYAERLKEAGIQASSATLEDLQKLPFTRKDDLRDHYPFGLFAVPREEVARIHASSGTTGKPTVVGYTKDDLQVFGEVCARSLAAAGATSAMRLHNAYGYGLFTGGLGMHAGGETLGMTVVPVSGGMTDRQIRLLQDFSPEVICCTPSYALTLAGEFRKRGIERKDYALQYAVLGAEPWTEAIRQEVEEQLQIKATNIYGLSEIIGPGVSQEAVGERGTGSYIWEDHFYPEVVHPETGEVLPEGEVGVLCLTTLTKQALPLIRYWTGDLCWLKRNHGGARTHVKMGPVVGRSDDMLIIRGVNLFPSQLEEVLGEMPAFSPHYQIVVEREKTLDTVKLRVEPSTPLSEESRLEKVRELQRRIHSSVGLNLTVLLEEEGSVPRSEGGKLSRVNDRRTDLKG